MGNAMDRFFKEIVKQISLKNIGLIVHFPKPHIKVIDTQMKWKGARPNEDSTLGR